MSYIIQSHKQGLHLSSTFSLDCVCLILCKSRMNLIIMTVHLLLMFSQIKEKLLQLTDKRKDMIDKWEDRWEWLRLGKMLIKYSV